MTASEASSGQFTAMLCSEHPVDTHTPSSGTAPHFDMLPYLARYTHRVAIANSRLMALSERGVTFRYKDYRRNGQARYRTMTLAADEFIRRFLLHVLPRGFTASATTGCSPAPAARPTLPAPGS
jgi:hypothetical protein